MRLLQLEGVLTSTTISMPIMNVFFAQKIGMNMAEVGLSQAAFTLAMLLFNIPTGWLADRFSRRLANMSGDLLAGLGFLGYAFAHTFPEVILYEVIIGIGVALTTGADNALLRAYSEKLGLHYGKVEARTNKYKPIGAALGMIVGGIIGAYDVRLAVGLTAVPYLLGAACSYLLVEAGERRKTDRHPIRDMASIAKKSLYGHSELAWSVLGKAVGSNATHPIIWVLTPLMVLAGVPVAYIGVGWALTMAGSWLGAHLAEHYAYQLSPWQRYGISIVALAVCSGTLAISVNIFTIWIYAGFGVIRGWQASTMTPIVQSFIRRDEISTVMSVADSLARVLYIPLVWLFGWLAIASPQYTMAANIVVFVPLMLLVTYKLKVIAPNAE
ncbi:MFS transporter [Candidatus Saccharibacteria bacterium]|nr:MFS transporter [Candidatus Saccharibacteria bacterium]